MADKNQILELRLTAAKCRKNVLRMVRAGGHGHVGGALSAIDIVTALYFGKMNIDPDNPEKEDRDRFLLSAGHKCLAQYAVLAERGYFPREVLDTYGQLGSRIPGHPDMHKLPGIEANTGALGHGISIAAGIALSAKISKTNYSVYAITGDGELTEGSNWEGAAAAAKFMLDNLTVFVDYNHLQISGDVTEVMNMEPVDAKFADFGWAVRVIDGNDMNQIMQVLEALPFCEGKPSLVLCKTVKAKGLSFGENQAAFHFWDASEELICQAEAELDDEINQICRKLEKE